MRNIRKLRRVKTLSESQSFTQDCGFQRTGYQPLHTTAIRHWCPGINLQKSLQRINCCRDLHLSNILEVHHYTYSGNIVLSVYTRSLTEYIFFKAEPTINWCKSMEPLLEVTESFVFNMLKALQSCNKYYLHLHFSSNYMQLMRAKCKKILKYQHRHCLREDTVKTELPIGGLWLRSYAQSGNVSWQLIKETSKLTLSFAPYV